MKNNILKTMRLIKTLAWLHLLRLHRYKYGFLNMILIDILWYHIFLLGAITFVPSKEFEETIIFTFWGVVLWIMLNNWVWLISGWTWFAVSIGVVDPHIIYNVNPIIFISFRFITALIISIITIPIVSITFSLLIGKFIFIINSFVYFTIGFLIMIAYITLYAIILVAVSLKTSIPGFMLDVINIFLYIGGGLGVPVSKVPDYLKPIILLIPYTHAAEIIRYSVLCYKPYLGLENELIYSIMYLMAMLIISTIAIRKSMKYVRKHGTRSIGLM